MRRLKDYARFLAWNFGLSYVALWVIAFWTLDYGQSVFSQSGVCQPDPATVLFYWVCDRASPMSILATLANASLTLTVWGPVYVAAATVKPVAIAIAGPIVVAHLVGLSTTILITTRVMLEIFQIPRRLWLRRAHAAPAEAAAQTPRSHEFIPQRLQRTLSIKPREEFGLRGATKA